ncbi:hypothetical protein V8C26DRAFT_415442 [Trichoderma gracile]
MLLYALILTLPPVMPSCTFLLYFLPRRYYLSNCMMCLSRRHLDGGISSSVHSTQLVTLDILAISAAGVSHSF